MRQIIPYITTTVPSCGTCGFDACFALSRLLTFSQSVKLEMSHLSPLSNRTSKCYVAISAISTHVNSKRPDPHRIEAARRAARRF